MLGRSLSHYEILEKIGRGGMGEVYRARDLHLGRDVAIKVLKEELASDPERLRRFEQEARAASALNHPNIVHIYDIGRADSTYYIAMEYVEGKTLRELLSGGPLPPDKLLRYSTQIAEGLAKAHSAGIIHRDLKPENLMVTSDGYVKILDFGLAKLLPQPGADSKAATITKEGTVTGAVIGTAGYMSPVPMFVYWFQGRADLGLQYGMKFNQMAPDNLLAKFSPATLLAWHGRYEEAFDLIDSLATAAPGHPLSEAALLFKHCLRNDEAAVKSMLSKELRDFAWEDYYFSWYLSNCFALINDETESLNWLERAVDKGLINYPLLSRDDPFLENVRGERFRELMERVEYEWEHFEI